MELYDHYVLIEGKSNNAFATHLEALAEEFEQIGRLFTAATLNEAARRIRRDELERRERNEASVGT